MDVRSEIARIAKRLATEEVSDAELQSFVSQARDYMMEHSNVVPAPEQNKLVDVFSVGGTKVQIFQPTHSYTSPTGEVFHYKPLMSCSCGSREDSCDPCESYDGTAKNASIFGLSEQGNSIRFLTIKDAYKEIK